MATCDCPDDDAGPTVSCPVHDCILSQPDPRDVTRLAEALQKDLADPQEPTRVSDETRAALAEIEQLKYCSGCGVADADPMMHTCEEGPREEVRRLRVEVASLRRALAAGPAALRTLAADARRMSGPGSFAAADHDDAADCVEAAQRRAIEEGVMPTRVDSEAERVLLMTIRPYIDAAYARGRADERADVVAWLRAGGPALPDAARWPCDDFAEHIERGIHFAAQKRAITEEK